MPALGGLELLHEELEQINLSDAAKQLHFPHSTKWRKSVLTGRRTSPFISSDDSGDQRLIRLHQDGESGRPRSFRAATLPRSVLSTVNATESPTALLARRELQSWRLLQLEPTALRRADNFTTPPGLGMDGSNLPATLDYLARTQRRKNGNGNGHASESWVYEQVAQRLSELIEDVVDVRVDRDEKRQLLTLEITDRNHTVYPARSLSDGTLRFLALAIIEIDPQAQGVICLEEPENGIHPERIAAILRLLQHIAVDVHEPVDSDNPLRQVIVNTHSPAVVLQVPDDSLLVVETVERLTAGGRRFRSARFGWLPDTWRAEPDPEHRPVTKGQLLAYLNPVSATDETEPLAFGTKGHKAKDTVRRVMDRSDLQIPLFTSPSSER